MSKVLVIQAHPHVENSLSLAVGKEFIESYKKSHPSDTIIIRDLFTKEGVPPLNNMTMDAWHKQKFGETMSAEEINLLATHEEWLNEFIDADKYVFINPMYNHFLPAEMKQYLDLTAVAHKTFKYTPDGSVGLLKGKKAIHIQSAGSIYHEGGKLATVSFLIKKALKIKSNKSAAIMDLGDLYLTNMMKFYGINDVEKLFIEGADAQPKNRQKILTSALTTAKKLAQSF
ncbi:MAG: NAD(P)H-dependent oxidoreductase [Enterococcus sp.]